MESTFYWAYHLNVQINCFVQCNNTQVLNCNENTDWKTFPKNGIYTVGIPFKCPFTMYKAIIFNIEWNISLCSLTGTLWVRCRCTGRGPRISFGLLEEERVFNRLQNAFRGFKRPICPNLNVQIFVQLKIGPTQKNYFIHFCTSSPYATLAGCIGWTAQEQTSLTGLKKARLLKV